MKPKPNVRQAQRELFRVELEQLVDAGHPLVKLGQQINWAGFEERLGATYAVANGAPGRSTRLLVALHYLKYQHDLSDEAAFRVVNRAAGPHLSVLVRRQKRPTEAEAWLRPPAELRMFLGRWLQALQ